MAHDAIVFACANPVPEIWPSEAIAAGARIVATGRGDFPNQLNNALVFPGLFRGVLDVRARTITDELASTVARALAGVATGRGLREDRILPPLDDLETHVTVAVGAGMAAQAAGVARVAPSRVDLAAEARRLLQGALDATRALMSASLIADAAIETAPAP